MAEGKIRSVFTGDASGLLREMEKLQNKFAAHETALHKLTSGAGTVGVQMETAIKKGSAALEDHLKILARVKSELYEEKAAIDAVDAAWARHGQQWAANHHHRQAVQAGIAASADRSTSQIAARSQNAFRDILLNREADIAWQAGADGRFRDMVRSVISARGSGAGGGLDLRKHNDELRETNSLMAGWGQQLLGVAAGYIGIQQAASALMGVHQEMTKMHGDAAAGMINAAPIQQGLAEAFPEGNDFQLAMMGATAISKKYGIPLQELNQVLKVTSSKNEGQLDRALAITEITAQAKRYGMAQEGGQYSLGISNLMNAIPGLKPEQASSMLQVIGQKGSIVSQGMIAEHISPAALASIANADLTKVTKHQAVAEALAGASTLAKYGSDEEGRLAFTNWQAFSEKAKEFAGKNGIEFKGTPMATMRGMTADQRTAFDSELGGEQRMKPFVRLLAIMQDQESNRFFDDMTRSIHAESVGTGKMHHDLAERLEGATPAMRIANASGKLKAIFDNSQLNKEIEAAAAVSADAMTHFQTAEKTIMGSAEGQAGQRIGMTFDQWINNAGQGAKNLLRTPMGQLEARRDYMESEINRFENSPEMRVARRSPQYSEQLKEMKELKDAVVELIAAVRENTGETTKNTEDAIAAASGVATGGLGFDQKRRAGRR